LNHHPNSLKKVKSQNRRIDIINEVLEECILAFPVSSFIISLYQRYQKMGSLSKKQLQGLYDKASKIDGLAPNKIATLEAIIKRMPTRYKSEKPEAKPLFEKDVATGKLIDEILAINPEHKRVLYLKAKYVNNEPLSTAELGDLQRFKRMGSLGTLKKGQQ
jgi:DNA repair protein RadC